MFDITKNEDGSFTVTETHSLAETSWMPIMHMRYLWSQADRANVCMAARFYDAIDLSSPESYKKWVKAWKEVEKLIVKYQRHYKRNRKISVLRDDPTVKDAEKEHYARTEQAYWMSGFAYRWYSFRADMKIKAAKAREERLAA